MKLEEYGREYKLTVDLKDSVSFGFSKRVWFYSASLNDDGSISLYGIDSSTSEDYKIGTLYGKSVIEFASLFVEIGGSIENKHNKTKIFLGGM